MSTSPTSLFPPHSAFTDFQSRKTSPLIGSFTKHGPKRAGGVEQSTLPLLGKSAVDFVA